MNAKLIINTVLALKLVCFKTVAQDLTEVKNFGSNPGNISMFYFSPDIKKSNEKLPLVIALHGCTQTAKSMAEQSGWIKLAQQHRFIVIFPQQHVPNNPQHCFNWFRSADTEKDKGEAGSIKQMMDYAFKTLHADSASVFVYGLSAGAAMAVALMADYPQLIKAGAIFAGTPYKMANNVIEGSRVMVKPYNKSCKEWAALVKSQNPNYSGPFPKILIWQGSNDKVVNPKSAEELTEQWAELHNADLIPYENISSYQSCKDITRITYTNPSGEWVIRFYLVNNLGHALPVWPGENENQGGKTGPFAIDIKFHSTYEVASQFGLVKKQ